MNVVGVFDSSDVLEILFDCLVVNMSRGTYIGGGGGGGEEGGGGGEGEEGGGGDCNGEEGCNGGGEWSSRINLPLGLAVYP